MAYPERKEPKPWEILRGCIKEERLTLIIGLLELAVETVQADPNHPDRDELKVMRPLLAALRTVRDIAYPPSDDHQAAAC